THAADQSDHFHFFKLPCFSTVGNDAAIPARRVCVVCHLCEIRDIILRGFTSLCKNSARGSV
ncbi:hypothetical protein ACCS96_49065, partial [Rhizobium ruizarguesonis]